MPSATGGLSLNKSLKFRSKEPDMSQPQEAELPLTGQIVQAQPKRQSRAVRVQEAPAQPPAPVSETAAVLSMIERVARDPSVDIDRLERLLTLQRDTLAQQAKMAFARDFAAMQSSMPTINEYGEIKHKDRDNPRAEAQLIGTYAYWEDINEAILPVLAQFGFSLNFRVQRDADQVVVTGILSHKEGHTEETALPLPHDHSGKKNAVQAIGSAISYGKRYTATLLLNLTTRNDETDDDGETAVNNKSSSQARADGDWDKIVAEFEGAETMVELGTAKNEWKAKVPKGWLRQLEDLFRENVARIRAADFGVRQ
jgi:hypothetical protein